MKFCDPFVNRPVCDGIVCPPPEKTQVQQHFKDECDIHIILKRIEHGGDPSVLQARKGFYVDLTELPVDNLRDAYDAVGAAEEAFMALPSDVRSKFDNDPYLFAEHIVKNGVESVAPLFGEKAAPTEPEPKNATTINDDANQGDGETA